jgi:putative Mg2+ transporter-C (MgtC) family protein
MSQVPYDIPGDPELATVIGAEADAASIWITGLIGIAVAMHRYEIAILMSAISFLTLRLAGQVKPAVSDDD